MAAICVEPSLRLMEWERKEQAEASKSERAMGSLEDGYRHLQIEMRDQSLTGIGLPLGYTVLTVATR